MTYKRNELGLLEGVKYEYNEDGSINWRAMVSPEHLYPNKSWFEMRNQPMPHSVAFIGHLILKPVPIIPSRQGRRIILTVEYHLRILQTRQSITQTVLLKSF